MMEFKDLVLAAGGTSALLGILAVAIGLAVAATLIGLAITANANKSAA